MTGLVRHITIQARTITHKGQQEILMDALLLMGTFTVVVLGLKVPLPAGYRREASAGPNGGSMAWAFVLS